MIVTNCTLDSSGRLAMNATCAPTWSASMRASGMTCPCACICPFTDFAVIGVAALPMSTWPQAMSNGRPSSEIVLVRPVTACLVEV